MSLLNRFRGSFRKNALGSEIDDELRFHVEMREREFVAQGMALAEARSKAMQQFGNPGLIREQAREMDSLGWIEAVWHDLRFAGRMLRKNPDFAAIAILTLALGIGVSTAIFSVVYGVLLRPLPYPAPGQLVTLQEKNSKLEPGPVSAADFYDWQSQNRVFEAVAGYTQWRFNLTGVAEPEQVRGALVTSRFFTALGVAAKRGRTFLPDEDQPGKDPVVVVSERLWNRLFGAGAELRERSITLNGSPAAIVGIMPASFAFPSQDADLWVPLAMSAANRQNREGRWLSVVARIKSEVNRQQAQEDMNVIASQLARAYPATNAGWGASLVPLRDQIVGPSRTTLLVLLGAVGFLLLIACSNVANLLLARSAGRSHEMALRRALGAGRLRIARQLLTENLVLAGLGGSLGLALAFWSVSIIRTMDPTIVPRLQEVTLDARVLAFAMAVSALTAFVFGLAPAFNASRSDLVTPLKSGGRNPMAGPGAQRHRSVFVVVEIALAMMLLVGAGLLGRSLVGLLRVDPGFDQRNILSMQLTLPQSRYRSNAQHVAFFQQVLARIQALPGVESVGGVSDPPLRQNRMSFKLAVEGAVAAGTKEKPEAGVRWVTPEYFKTMRINLREGRYFGDSDTATSQSVAIVSRSLARRFWPNENPIGKRIRMDEDERWSSVVGVVSDIRQTGLETEEGPALYLPHAQKAQEWLNWMSLAVRTKQDPRGLAAAVRAQVWAVDKDQPIGEIAPLEHYLSQSAALPQLRAWLLGGFSILALLMAVVGIYGVIQYSVSQRIHEIGVRLALGATPASIVQLILRGGIKLTLTGLAIGMAGALATTRFLETLLFQVRPIDAGTFIGVPALLLLVAMLACYIPARRAMRVDAAVALRQE